MSVPTFHPSPVRALPELPTENAELVRRKLALDTFAFEPTSRWVRGVVDGVTIVDSRNQVLLWEPGHKVPEYAFPAAHVRTDLLVPATAEADTSKYWRPRTERVEWFDIVVGDRVVPSGAWRWLVPGLEDYIGVSWFPGVIDAWYEEDEEVIVHPRDAGNRIDVIPTSRHVQVYSDGVLLADSHAAVALFEHALPTRFYLPAEDVLWDKLEEVDLTTQCPYKGTTDGYWKVQGGNGDAIAWRYTQPFHQVAAVKDRIAFYNERLDLVVDGEPFIDSPRTWA